MSRHESAMFDFDSSEPEKDPGNEASELEMLQGENAQLQQSLDENTTKLFEFFREDGQVTDTSLQQDFENLRSSTASWIEDVLLDSEPRNFSKHWEKLSQQRSDALSSLALPEQMFRHAQSSSNGSVTRPKNPIHWLGRRSNCERLIVTRSIWRFLSEHIFDRRWPIGARDMDREKSLMSEVFDIMTKKEEDSGKDFSLIELL